MQNHDGWYVTWQGKIQGPLPWVKLQELAARGRLKPEMELSSDRQSWSKAADMPGLYGVEPVDDFLGVANLPSAQSLRAPSPARPEFPKASPVHVQATLVGEGPLPGKTRSSARLFGLFLCAAILAVLALGAVMHRRTRPPSGSSVAWEQYAKIQSGMSKEVVLSILGSPDEVEGSNWNGGAIQVCSWWESPARDRKTIVTFSPVDGDDRWTLGTVLRKHREKMCLTASGEEFWASLDEEPR